MIVEHGLWGQRASEMGTRMGCNVVPLPLAPGQGFETFEKIEEVEFSLGIFSGIFFTNFEKSFLDSKAT